MAHKITIQDAATADGYSSIHAMMLHCVIGDRIEVPACCSDGCVVEPDGYCEHGFPSVMIEEDMI